MIRPCTELIHACSGSLWSGRVGARSAFIKLVQKLIRCDQPSRRKAFLPLGPRWFAPPFVRGGFPEHPPMSRDFNVILCLKLLVFRQTKEILTQMVQVVLLWWGGQHACTGLIPPVSVWLRAATSQPVVKVTKHGLSKLEVRFCCTYGHWWPQHQNCVTFQYQTMCLLRSIN